MKPNTLCVALLAAFLCLQGCAVNVIVAPNATFVGGDQQGDSVEDQNNGRVTNVVVP